MWLGLGMELDVSEPGVVFNNHPELADVFLPLGESEIAARGVFDVIHELVGHFGDDVIGSGIGRFFFIVKVCADEADFAVFQIQRCEDWSPVF